MVKLTTLWPQLMKFNRKSVGVGVLTNAGFEKCATADHLMANGMEGILHLPKWSPESKKNIDKIFTKYKINEVVDVSEVLDVTPQIPDSGYYDLMRVIPTDPDCDIAILVVRPRLITCTNTF